MKNIFDSKFALITGGSSGIGFGLASQLIQLGGNVAILARRKNILDEAVLELETHKIKKNQQIIPVQADVTRIEDLSIVLSNFIEDYQVPDFIFNSAGVAHPGTFTNLAIDKFHWMMDVNYFGTVNVLKFFVPLFQRQRNGYIINISSIAGVIGVYGYTAYGASKFAVGGLTDALRAELMPYGIKVSIVFPPDTETPQLEYEKEFKPFITKEIAGSANILSAEKVAKLILRDVSRQKYLIIPGNEGKILFLLKNILGGKLYPIMDMIIYSSIRKLRFKK